MRSAARGELMATEIADYLVRAKQVPFREAHHITGRIVSFAEQQGKNIDELSLDEYRAHSEHFDADIFEYLDPRKSLIEKRSAGSTNPDQVRQAITDWRARCQGIA
jgi:argininosuccinate lyase